MTQWANYLVSAVRFNPRHTHLDRFRVHVDNGDTVGPAQDVARAQLVAAMKQNNSVMTIYSGPKGWKPGAKVLIDRIGGVDYLTTAPNGRPVDNLDNLPEY